MKNKDSTLLGGIAGITAMVIATHRKNLTLVGIVLDPRPIIDIINAEIRDNGSKKSAMYWFITDSVISISSPRLEYC